MTIKQMVNRKMDTWGTNVLHVSSSKYIKCKCFNNITNQGNTKCPICLGTGNITSIKMIKAIVDIYQTREYEQQTGVGMSDNTPVQIYTKYNTILSQRDKIIVVGFKNGVIYDIKDIFVINNTNVHRMTNGITQGNVATATKINAEIKLYQRYLTNLTKEAKKILKDGGTYICKQ